MMMILKCILEVVWSGSIWLSVLWRTRWRTFGHHKNGGFLY